MAQRAVADADSRWFPCILEEPRKVARRARGAMCPARLPRGTRIYNYSLFAGKDGFLTCTWHSRLGGRKALLRHVTPHPHKHGTVFNPNVLSFLFFPFLLIEE